MSAVIWNGELLAPFLMFALSELAVARAGSYILDSYGGHWVEKQPIRYAFFKFE